ncbi:MAG: helix-turn-helix transcriptional regulator [Chloroflexota bacterium]
MPVTTARQRVLAQLHKSGRASARELARTLRMSEANVRHHLRVLAADGRVTASLVRAQGRGRPEKVFSLSAALAGDNLAGLAEALLSVERSTLNVERLAEVILNSSPFTNLPISKRLALLVEKLNERHYQSRWEAGAEGPRVIFGRCPYAAVIEGHPELCQMDASVLNHALNGDVRQIEKIEKGRGVCIFSIR